MGTIHEDSMKIRSCYTPSCPHHFTPFESPATLGGGKLRWLPEMKAREVQRVRVTRVTESPFALKKTGLPALWSAKNGVFTVLAWNHREVSKPFPEKLHRLRWSGWSEAANQKNCLLSKKLLPEGEVEVAVAHLDDVVAVAFCWVGVLRTQIRKVC